MSDEALPVHLRPFTTETFTTEELPDTPTRTFRIPATSWIDAPRELLTLGDGLGEPVEYKRRIGRFLLWRAGPPVGEAIYLAIDGTESYTFALHGRQGAGVGPDGVDHHRFRAWKESLLASVAEPEAGIPGGLPPMP